MPYRVQLQNFEGPLDLLLFLIKKSEVEIYDIPVADITQQYLEYLTMIDGGNSNSNQGANAAAETRIGGR